MIPTYRSQRILTTTAVLSSSGEIQFRYCYGTRYQMPHGMKWRFHIVLHTKFVLL